MGDSPWDFWSVIDTISGPIEVEFTNKTLRKIDVQRCIKDMNGHPIYLEDKNGVLYNWQVIISIKRVER